MIDDGAPAAWRPVLIVGEIVAFRFACLIRRPPVLVIDNVERLAESASVMGEVLHAAKEWADRGLVRVVLVSSDDALITRLLGLRSHACFCALVKGGCAPCLCPVMTP